MGSCCFRAAPEPPAIPEPSRQDHTVNPPRTHAREHGHGVGAGNKLICKKPPAWAAEHPITRGQLLSQRDAYWDTAPSYGGKPEIWQALRAAAESDDVATAQAIADAVNITLPAGNLSVVYDELGNKYDIPPYCLSYPTNLIQQVQAFEEEPLDADAAGGAAAAAAEPWAERPAPPAEEAAPAGSEISIKLRVSTVKDDQPWAGPEATTIGQLKGHLAAAHGVPRPGLRCLYGGQILQDTQTLAGARVVPGSVVLFVAAP